METERLILRLFTKEQLKEAKNFSLEQAQLFFALDTQELIDKELTRLEYHMLESSEGFINWYIVEKSSGKTIGDIGLHSWIKKHDKAEIGYLLHPDVHGKGYATEAGKAVIAYAFEQTNIYRVEAHTAKDNIASQRVLQKLGFQYEGLRRGHYKLPDHYSDSLGYGMLKPDFEKLTSE